MAKTWLITGANRGIGLKIAQAALSAGDNVVATGRNMERLQAAFGEPTDRLCFAQLDVQSPEQAINAVDVAQKTFGRLDVLVNNAGFGQLGHFETISKEAVEKQFATNVFGLMHVTRAALPVMRSQRSGHIISLSSIGGAVGFDGASVYCATKFAVEGFCESLALEITRFGLKITIVEPGFFRTDFLDSSSVKYGETPIDDYAKAIEEQRSQYDNYSHAQPGDPQKLAAIIVQIAAEENPPLRLVAGADAYDMSKAMLDARLNELEKWRATTVSTSHE